MFGWSCWRFQKTDKLFLILLMLSVFQKNILLADPEPVTQEQSIAQKPVNQESVVQEQPVAQDPANQDQSAAKGAGADQVTSKTSQKNYGGDPAFNAIQGLFNSGENGGDPDTMRNLLEEIFKIAAAAKKREEERKLLFFSKLSPEHQDLIKALQAKYNKFLEDVDIRNGLAELCNAARGSLESLRDSFNLMPEHVIVALLNDVLVKIEKLQTAIALDCCLFLPKRIKGMSSKGVEDLSGVMNGLMQQLMPGGQGANVFTSNDGKEAADSENSDAVFSLKDVYDLCSSLRKLISYGVFKYARSEQQEISALKAKTKNLVVILNDILSAMPDVLNGKPKDLILCYINYIEPEFNAAVEELNKVEKVFELEVKAYIANYQSEKNKVEGEKDLSETEIIQIAYISWFKEIKKYQRTLLVFSELKRSTTSFVAGTDKLFEAVAYAYDVAHCFYDFYRHDVGNVQDKIGHYTPLNSEEQAVLANASHWSNKGILSPNAIDWGFSSFMASWFFFMKRPDAADNLLLQSIFGNLPLNMVTLTQTMILNVMVALPALRVLINPSAFNWQPQSVLRSLGKVVGAWTYYNIFYRKLFGPDNGQYWDPNYANIKTSTYNLLMEVESLVTSRFAFAIRQNTNPELVEKVEHWSLGVVKPEMIEDFAEAMLPLLLVNENGSSSYAGEVFGTYGIGSLNSKSGAAHMPEYYNIEAGLIGGVSPKSYYIEACISYYIASSVGRTLGTAIAKRVQGPFLNFATYTGGKFLDGLAWLHIISKDTREMFTDLGEEFSEDLEFAASSLKMIFKEAFTSNSSLNKMLVSMLNNSWGNSKAEINRELLYFLLKNCARLGYMTHLEEAIFMKDYLVTQRLDDELIEKIISTIEKNMFASLGGLAGSRLAPYALGWFVTHNGPIQLVPGKIKNAVFGK